MWNWSIICDPSQVSEKLKFIASNDFKYVKNVDNWQHARIKAGLQKRSIFFKIDNILGIIGILCVFKIVITITFIFWADV